jgi:hypothetical protein
MSSYVGLGNDMMSFASSPMSVDTDMGQSKQLINLLSLSFQWINYFTPYLFCSSLLTAATAFLSLQLNMIGWLDDMSKFCLPELRQWAKYPNIAFLCRFPWSKNVREERDAPLQLVFAAGNPWYDCHSLMSLWLEYRFEFALTGLKTPSGSRIQSEVSLRPFLGTRTLLSGRCGCWGLTVSVSLLLLFLEDVDAAR